MKNTNCLAGFKCPGCGSTDAFIIECKVLQRVTDDGTDDTDDSNREWDNDSYCRCEACDFSGKVLDFQEPV